MFLSQSVLTGERNLCGARLCHEIAHSWFGLAIGARDWTEEWISEGFATYLEDVFWSHVQKVLWYGWIFERLSEALFPTGINMCFLVVSWDALLLTPGNNICSNASRMTTFVQIWSKPFHFLLWHSASQVVSATHEYYWIKKNYFKQLMTGKQVNGNHGKWHLWVKPDL